MEDDKPIYGKTYSLFGQEKNTVPFYSRIATLTDKILVILSIPETQALEYIQSLSKNRKKLKMAAARARGYSALTDMLELIDHELFEYVPGLQQHLKEVSLVKFLRDREMLISKEQYYLYMIEFELVNRVHKKEFMDVDFRIALLPYCLKESQSNCKASPDEIDYICRGCLKTCAINKLGKILKDHGINPYILSRGRLKSMFQKLHKKNGSIGVFGVACVVELIQGMRFCMEAKLPVMGIPLNANRCPRWMGDFLDTSVDLSAIKNLLN